MLQQGLLSPRPPLSLARLLLRRHWSVSCPSRSWLWRSKAAPALHFSGPVRLCRSWTVWHSVAAEWLCGGAGGGGQLCGAGTSRCPARSVTSSRCRLDELHDLAWPASASLSLTACHWSLPHLRRWLRLAAARREALCFCDSVWLCRSAGQSCLHLWQGASAGQG